MTRTRRAGAAFAARPRARALSACSAIPAPPACSSVARAACALGLSMPSRDPCEPWRTRAGGRGGSADARRGDSIARAVDADGAQPVGTNGSVGTNGEGMQSLHQQCR